MKAVSDGSPRYFAEAPVAMMSASQVYVPLSPVRVNGRLAQVDGLLIWSKTIICVEAFGMLQKALHQFGSLHAMGVSRPVVYVGGGHQLTALRNARDQHRVEVGSGCIHSGRIACRTRTQNEHAGVFVGCHEVVRQVEVSVDKGDLGQTKRPVIPRVIAHNTRIKPSPIV
jgi:hypothetical protein